MVGIAEEAREGGTGRGGRRGGGISRGAWKGWTWVLCKNWLESKVMPRTLDTYTYMHNAQTPDT